MNYAITYYENNVLLSFSNALILNKLKLEDESLNASVKKHIANTGLWGTLISIHGLVIGLTASRCIVNFSVPFRVFSMFFNVLMMPGFVKAQFHAEMKRKYLPMALNMESTLFEIDPGLKKQKDALMQIREKKGSGYPQVQPNTNIKKSEWLLEYSATSKQSQKMEEFPVSNLQYEKPLEDSRPADLSSSLPQKNDFSNISADPVEDYNRFQVDSNTFFNDPYRQVDPIKSETVPDGPYSFYINQAKNLAKPSKSNKEN